MSLDKLLDSCLLDIEDGRASLEDCMARYPEVAPLLEVVVQLQALPRPDPSPQFVQATRARLQTVAAPAGNGSVTRLPAARPAPAPRRTWPRLALPRLGPLPALPRWQPAFAGLVAVFVAVLILGVGSVVASADALPASPLYGVKLMVERTQLLLASRPEQQAALHVEFARRRLDEAVRVAALGDTDEAERLIGEYRRELQAAVSIAEQAVNQGGGTEQLPKQLLEKVREQRTEVESAGRGLPAPAANQALDAADHAGDALTDLAPEPRPGAIVPQDEVTPASTPVPATEVPAFATEVPPSATAMPVVVTPTPQPARGRSTPTPVPGLSPVDETATTVPIRATIAPLVRPSSTPVPASATPEGVTFGSPTVLAPTAVPTDDEGHEGATPTPVDTQPPQATSTPVPPTATSGPPPTSTRNPWTPRPSTPTAVPPATSVPTSAPDTATPEQATAVPTAAPEQPTDVPTSEPTSIPSAATIVPVADAPTSGPTSGPRAADTPAPR